MITREALIRKIELQNGMADAIDAYRICALYTELYGIKFYRNIEIEDELIIMFEKLKQYKGRKRIYNINIDKKVCRKCNEEKLLKDFHKLKSSKDGRNYICAKCSNKAHTEWKERKNKLKNEKSKN